ncbi:hypothetical protein QYE76_048784 [Lolium multiflorum]|uniref:Uncharacterized protein n=1 Tax=Lolium multiflorum TaxID=4521 RepID=A0AAD8WHP4_LOLMU|nr:hypothetical protein QYE76_048784 [Lolium multiflorum]
MIYEKDGFIVDDADDEEEEEEEEARAGGEQRRKKRKPELVHSSTIYPSASGSQIVPAVDVEDDAEIEDQSPQDDENELMFPELVDRCSKQAMEDQYMEDIAQGARFDDDEEKDENNDSLVLADYEDKEEPGRPYLSTSRGSARDLLMMKNTKTAAVPTVVIDAKIIEAIAYNIASTAQIQPSMSEPVDVSLLLPSSDPLLMKDTKTATVPTVVIDAKIIEAIAYNIALTAQIQPSVSEPIDVSLPLPSSDPLLMKDTKTAAVPTVVIDAKIIEAIAYNIASTAQIQPSSMSHFRCRECESMPRRLKPLSTTALRSRRSSRPPCPSLRMAQMTIPQPPVVPTLLAHRCTAVFDAANWDKL